MNKLMNVNYYPAKGQAKSRKVTGLALHRPVQDNRQNNRMIAVKLAIILYRGDCMANRTDNPKPATIWAREHPEKVKGYVAKRLEKNPDYYKEKARQWEIDNPEKRQAYLEKNRERRAALAKQWGKDHPDKRAEASRKYLLKKRFGDQMMPDKFQEMFDAQKGKCAICGIAPLDKHLSIDHDHESGAVRGLLCNSCNLALGNVKENTLILENMIRYLNRTTIRD